MFKFIIELKIALDKKFHLHPETREDSILMAMGLPYLESNSVDLFNLFTLSYLKKSKTLDFSENEYECFLHQMDSYYNSFSNRNILANPIFTLMNLKEEWNILGKKSAKNTLNWLQSEGHRSFLHEVYNWKDELISENLDTIKEFICYCDANEIDVPYFYREFNSYDFSEEKLKKSNFYKELNYNINFSKQFENEMPNCGILAWDMARFINLVRLCRIAKYISAKEAWEYVRSVEKLCFNSFYSWNEFAQSFKIGRKYWLRGKNTSFNPEAYCDYLLKNNLNSWMHFKWNKKEL